MMVSPMQKMSLRVRGLLNDRSGLAAVEFAMVFPIMVVLYFGVVEFSSAIAVDRKAPQVARTLSDLTSQSITVGDADIRNFGEAAKAIMTPYPPSPLVSSITEVYSDSVSGIALNFRIAVPVSPRASSRKATLISPSSRARRATPTGARAVAVRAA